MELLIAEFAKMDNASFLFLAGIVLIATIQGTREILLTISTSSSDSADATIVEIILKQVLCRLFEEAAVGGTIREKT